MVNTLEKISEVDNIDKFIESFSNRYSSEKRFRNIVHKHLKIKGIEKLGLSIGGVIRPGWYKQKTSEMIKEYAIQIREKTIQAKELKEEIARIREAEKELKEREKEKNNAEFTYSKAQEEYYTIQNQKELKEREAKEKLNNHLSEEEIKEKENKAKINKLTSAEEIAKEQLIQFTKNSSFIKKKDDGSFVFNEPILIKKLEDIFLEEIVEGIEKESGSKGFLGRTKKDYDGVLAYYAEIESLSELPNVNWEESIIYSRSKGFRYPTFPYLISGKFEKRGRTTLDTALIFDRSYSMNEGENEKRKIIAARKTALATNALMRKLNPKNETFLACYNQGLTELTSKEVLNIEPDDGTDTALALNWLLDKLKDRGPSFAYLITDGLPNSLEDSIKAAENFKRYPNIMLRLFLIYGNDKYENERSKQNIKAIGKAAGLNTKVSCVYSNQLATGAIKDLSLGINEMRYISEF
jgi:hypothetical protein